MDFLPAPERSRPLALMLLLVVLIAVYFIGFHWFVQRQIDDHERRVDLEDQLQRLHNTIAERPHLEAELAALRDQRRDDELFLAGSNFDTAAAELTRRLKDIISTQADEADRCQVISNQNIRPREKERFERVVVKVRLRCSLPDFIKVAAELELGLPVVLLDNVNIYQQVVASQVRQRRGVNPDQLDIRFDMMGYLKGAGGGRAG